MTSPDSDSERPVPQNKRVEIVRGGKKLGLDYSPKGGTFQRLSFTPNETDLPIIFRPTPDQRRGRRKIDEQRRGNNIYNLNVHGSQIALILTDNGLTEIVTFSAKIDPNFDASTMSPEEIERMLELNWRKNSTAT